MVVQIHITVFCIMIPCSLLCWFHCFREHTATICITDLYSEDGGNVLQNIVGYYKTTLCHSLKDHNMKLVILALPSKLVILSRFITIKTNDKIIFQ
jgi:hypothetical protein